MPASGSRNDDFSRGGAHGPRARWPPRIPARALLAGAWLPAAVLVLHAVVAASLGHRRELDPLFHLLGGAALAVYFTGVVAALRAPGAAAGRWSSASDRN